MAPNSLPITNCNNKSIWIENQLNDNCLTRTAIQSTKQSGTFEMHTCISTINFEVTDWWTVQVIDIIFFILVKRTFLLSNFKISHHSA